MAENAFNKRVNAVLGVIFLVLGAVFTCLVFVDRWTTIEIRFPSIWYRSRNFHVLTCLVLYAAGWWSHRIAGSMHDSTYALFRSVQVYSKPECSLCDRALEILSEFSSALPRVEVIDISGDAELEKLHAESVPVVVIDGRVRFRGIVSEELLQRIVDARRRQVERKGRQVAGGERNA